MDFATATKAANLQYAIRKAEDKVKELEAFPPVDVHKIQFTSENVMQNRSPIVAGDYLPPDVAAQIHGLLLHSASEALRKAKEELAAL